MNYSKEIFLAIGLKSRDRQFALIQLRKWLAHCALFNYIVPDPIEKFARDFFLF